MGEDTIRTKARRRERARRHQHLVPSPAFGVEAAREGMRGREIDLWNLIPVDRDAFDGLRALGADGGEFERTHLSQFLRNISELSRKVVVDEEKFHRKRSPCRQFATL